MSRSEALAQRLLDYGDLYAKQEAAALLRAQDEAIRVALSVLDGHLASGWMKQQTLAAIAKLREVQG